MTIGEIFEVFGLFLLEKIIKRIWWESKCNTKFSARDKYFSIHITTDCPKNIFEF